MNRADWAKEIHQTFLDAEQPLRSLFNFVTLGLILWNINPESIYYNWAIWAALAALWACLAMFLAGRRLISLLLTERMWLIGVWPAYTLALWLMGRGLIHRKFIAIGFMIAVPFFYLKMGIRKDLGVLSRIGAGYIGLIALTTVFQLVTYPGIARELAVGRGVGNFRASALLGNFHTVYEAVLLILSVGGAMLWLSHLKKRRGLQLLLLVNLLLVIFARYDIAYISLGFGILMLAVLKMKAWERGEAGSRLKEKGRSFRELFLTTLLYTAPAIALLIFRGPVNLFIDRMDLGQMMMSEKLFNRIWVYLRSLFLYLEFPGLGYGVQPDPAGFLVGQHSDYLDLLAEYGLIGFLIFLVPWLVLLTMMRRELPRSCRGFYWISVIIFHIIFILNPILEVSAVTVLFFILPGMFISFEKEPA